MMPIMSMMFSPSDEQRRTVKALAAVGVPHEAIAGYLDIDPKTLRKHCRQELDHGMLEANVKVAQTLFSMATVDRNTAACIFWLKARGGWREKNMLDTDGNPVEPITVIIRTGVPRDGDGPDGRRLIESDKDAEDEAA
jgi:hypothetical protein